MVEQVRGPRLDPERSAGCACDRSAEGEVSKPPSRLRGAGSSAAGPKPGRTSFSVKLASSLPLSDRSCRQQVGHQRDAKHHHPHQS
jgi:hypothetical protein